MPEDATLDELLEECGKIEEMVVDISETVNDLNDRLGSLIDDIEGFEFEDDEEQE